MPVEISKVTSLSPRDTYDRGYPFSRVAWASDTEDHFFSQSKLPGSLGTKTITMDPCPEGYQVVREVVLIPEPELGVDGEVVNQVIERTVSLKNPGDQFRGIISRGRQRTIIQMTHREEEY